MLEITIPEVEYFNESTNEFFQVKAQTVKLEHSLVSVSKWESKWKKPFLDKTPKTREESVDYVRCMNMTQNVNPLAFNGLTKENMDEIGKYIEDSHTATWFNDHKQPHGQREIVTSELIYYWMVAFNIPMECQKWHLGRLITLIKICNLKSQKPKKMSRKQIMSNNHALNAARRAKFNSKG